MPGDKLFILKEGKSDQVAIFNRIAAIDRINFLSGVDLRNKSKEYLLVLDLEMTKRWYTDEPKNPPIDELWCQRVAEVVRAMEGIDVSQALIDVEKRVEQAYQHHQLKVNLAKNNTSLKKESNLKKFWKGVQDAYRRFTRK